MNRALILAACAASLLPPTTAGAQSVSAVRVSSQALQLDGRLSEEVWRTVPGAGGFLQREPTEGAPAQDSTVVRFAYDDGALWIGARMYSRDPQGIRALVTRRDREGSSERLIISLDTHRDKRTAYSFAVTPAEVRIDYFHTSDFERATTYDYNPVWDTRTRIDSLGWTAEMRIPFTQLRFNPAEIQDWGVNITRVVPATNEQSYFVLVRRNETGWSSRMAALTGIEGHSDPDFNVRSLRSNAVVRWEWRPGSTMFVVWQQDRGADRAVRVVRPSDIFDTFSATGDNILPLKVRYWIPLR